MAKLALSLNKDTHCIAPLTYIFCSGLHTQTYTHTHKHTYNSTNYRTGHKTEGGQDIGGLGVGRKWDRKDVNMYTILKKLADEISKN